ncbi:MAG TPA: beta-galactosidase GalB [Lacunisphaera sp.]|nr:beta-galactosidase GalB [Lacunisphaera sp.]
MRLKLRSLALLATLPVLLAAAPVRERLSFNADWRFAFTREGDWNIPQLDYHSARPWLLASSADLADPTAPRPGRPAGNFGGDVRETQPAFDDSTWRKLDVPHDWGIESPFRYEYSGDTGKLKFWGVAWYRKHFNLPAEDAGRHISLEVDGAMSYSEIWLNGQFVGGWPYGYTSFAVDLTPYLKAGAENVLVVRLDNPADSSRWYPGGGIYRNVWLVKSGPVHVAHWGTVVTTPRVSAAAADVIVNVLTDNETDSRADLTAATELFALDDSGRTTGPAIAAAPAAFQVPARRQASIAQNFVVTQPQLWSPAHPHRYLAVTTLKAGNTEIDRYETIFGIRTAVFDADRGFLLNGEPLKLNGVCDHHDLGALGTAINVRALERQLEILRSFGCNAIRTSHNPPAPELLDLCDRLGFVVMDEAFDCWVKGKRPYDYHEVFADWHERDLRALVRRDRNHPSVVLWSIGNEVPDQHDPDGWKLANRLAGIVREEDRTRPISSAYDNIGSGYNGMQFAVDALGYNYKPQEYARFHAAFPTMPLYGSETASTISSRGEYFFPLSDNKLDPAAREDFQVSSYDLFAEYWATSPDAEWKGQDANPSVAGEFVWTGFDYLGEPTPYGGHSTKMMQFTDPARRAAAEKELKETGRILVPSRSSYFGIVDLAGFPKDRYFIYQARWRPDLPMAHLLPHWTWPGREGQVTPVHVYTSGDEAELFLNGQSLGRKAKAPGTYRLRWDDVKYAPGELKVVAYKNGAKWAEDVERTAGPAAKFTLAPDRAELHADGADLSFVTVRILDATGQLVPRAANRLHFEVTGPAEIVATDNGDATSFESFQSKDRNAYNGLALVIVRTKRGDPGAITLKATAEGLPAVETTLTAK